MKMYVPALGDEIRLTADWTFDLYNEYRNSTLLEFVGDTRGSVYHQQTAMPCTIPAGEILKIDRIYIRKGSKEYDSVTFYWKDARTQRKTSVRTVTRWETPAGEPTSVFDRIMNPFSKPEPVPVLVQVTDTIPSSPVRFWAKLDDVNNIEFEPVVK